MNEEAAKAIIGSLVQRPGTLASVQALGVTASDFPPYVADPKSTMPGTYRLVWNGLVELRDAGLLGEDDCTLMVKHHLNGKADLVDWQKITDPGIVASSDLTGFTRMLLADSNQHYVAARLACLTTAVAEGDTEGLATRLRELADASERGGEYKPRFNLIHASELDSLPKSDFLPGTHLIKGGYNVLVGHSGSAKSLYGMNDAYGLALLGPVVYTAAEGSGGLAWRRDAWQQHTGLDLGRIHFIVEAVNLLSDVEVSRFIADCKAKFPDGILLAIFDTKSRCMVGGDENSAQDDGLQVANCDRIRRELNCAVLIIHHTNKTGLSERGSNATRGAADLILFFSRDGDTITVSVQDPKGKLKDGEPWPDETFRFVQSGDSVVLEPSDRVAFEYSPIDETDESILRALEAVGDLGSSPTQLVRLLNSIPERTVYDRLKKLRESTPNHPALVHVEYCKKPRRSTYTLTDAGCKLLQPAIGTEQASKPNGGSVLVDGTAVLQENCKSTASESNCTARRLSLLGETQFAVTSGEVANSARGEVVEREF